jgi:hypothetical protein
VRFALHLANLGIPVGFLADEVGRREPLGDVAKLKLNIALDVARLIFVQRQR